MISGRLQVNHSYDMLMRAQARYDYQVSHIDSIGPHVESELAAKEKALLVALRDKLTRARTSHKKLLQEELSMLGEQKFRPIHIIDN